MAPAAARPGFRVGRALPRRRLALGLLLAVVAPPLLTACLVPLRGTLSLPSQVLLFLLLVVAVATVGGLGPALVGAVTGFLLLNWYFTPPLGTLAIGQRDHVLALVVFIVVAAAVSAVVEYAAASAAQAARADAESDLVARLAREAPAEVGLTSVLDELTQAFPVATVRVEERTAAVDGWTVLAEQTGTAPGSSTAVERTLDVADDRTLRLVLTGPPLFAEDTRLLGRFAAAVGTAVRSARLAEQAAAAERLSAAESLRTTLLAAVGHDLRTPLAGIKAAVSSLRQSDVAFSQEQTEELHATIEESADQLGRLLANLLDLSRLEAGMVRAVTEPVVLDGTVAEAVRSVGSPAVHWEIGEDLPAVQADPGLLERVVANLVANAVQHGGGRITLSATAETGDGETGAVVLHVADDGAGVAVADLERIFEPFQRLDDRGRREGLGLGLAVARGFVDAMGGRISASPTAGGGLTVSVRLPLAPTAQTAAAPGEVVRG
ncbi:MAG: two-component system, OmpR family, sensor histidine kinase KdpD [Frankiaceae bacterium]|nr:two-component system, OmpR family, sensor histidine kinase KdpD [Frankiaceae bacterium]